MKLKDFKYFFHSELDAIYGKEEVAVFFFYLIKKYHNLNRHSLAIDPDITINEATKKLYHNALKELKKERPIQYILGETEFLELPIKVNSNVLIPRPETEELVIWINNEINRNPESVINILDIGTGSGCIAIAIANKFPKINVYAIDISKSALQLAKENARINKVKINFKEANILVQYENMFCSELKFDIIISNPPYVLNKEKDKMRSNVLLNEPHLALFVDDEDPLLFYKAITNFAVKNLSEKGLLFFEINEYLGDEMKTLLKDNNFDNFEIKNDVFEKQRMVKAHRR